MNRSKLFRRIGTALFISLALALVGGHSAFAQGAGLKLHVTKVDKKSIKVSWNHIEPNVQYVVQYRRVSSRPSGYIFAGTTIDNSYTLSGLQRRATYQIEVYGGSHGGTVKASTLRNGGAEGYAPPAETCPHLPPRVVVSGYNGNTQCLVVEEAGVGRADLIERGFIDAVDVWNFTSHNVKVCFRNDGWLAFLDAAYSPRMVMELVHFHADGMTCGIIDRPGTVVLLAAGPSPDAPENPLPITPNTQTVAATLPTFEAIPLSDCQIKLSETLFLRAEPAGEIIGLVWLNTEVPAFEINGYWYQVEFEGKTGYISRYHRQVLRGGCG